MKIYFQLKIILKKKMLMFCLVNWMQRKANGIKNFDLNRDKKNILNI